MVKTITRTKRTTTVKSKKSEKCKNACKLGSKCPYKLEYQHQLEFSHDDNDNDNKNNQKSDRFPGKGYRLNNNNSHSNRRVDFVQRSTQLEDLHHNDRNIQTGSQSTNTSQSNTADKNKLSSSSLGSGHIISNENETDFDTDLNYAIQLSRSCQETNKTYNSSSSSSSLNLSNIPKNNATKHEEIIDLT